MLLPKNNLISLCPLISYPWPQFRYKTRVYKQTNLDEKQLAKLHTKVRVPCCPYAQSTLPITFFSSLSSATPQLCQVPHLTLRVHPVWRHPFISVITPSHFSLWPHLLRPMPSAPAVCMGGDAAAAAASGVDGCTCGGQRSTWGSQYSLSTIGVLRMELLVRLVGKHLCLMSHLSDLTLCLIQSFTVSPPRPD